MRTEPVSAPPASTPEHRPLRALALILLASLSFALVAMTVKEVANTPGVGVAPAVLSRGLCGLLVCGWWARRGGLSLRPRGWSMLALRCTAGIAAVGLYYRALGPGGTDMVTAAMLLKTSPLWVAVLSPAFVRERPGARVWGALALGLTGVLIVSLDPSRGWRPDLSQLGVALSLVAGLGSALAYLALRRLASTDDPVTVVAAFSLALTLASAPFVVGRPGDVAAWPARVWAVLAVAGVLGTAGQLFLTAAYRFGPAAAVTIAGLSEVAMQGLLSVVRFQEWPAPEALVGGALAMAAGLVASRQMKPAPAAGATALPAGLAAGEEPRRRG